MANSGVNVTFGFHASPADSVPATDKELYDDVIRDCALGYELGYDTAWMLEHHFSSYYPTPSPLLLMSHIARDLPYLNFGSAVLVLPWYNPMRLAGELAMLSNLTKGTLHIGMGRGTAKSEYDAHGVQMNEARGRFTESCKIITRALSQPEFTFEGKYFNVTRPLRLRPTPCDNILFYGAIGSPASATVMAELGLPPFCTAAFPIKHLTGILDAWKERFNNPQKAATFRYPIMIRLLVADTDEEAFAMARKYYPPYFKLQCEHYQTDSDPWANIEEYKDFSRQLANLRKLTDPNELDPYLKMNLIGSPETIRARLDKLIAVGFNHFMLSAALQGTPKSVRRESLIRFAKEIGPHYSRQFNSPEPAVKVNAAS